MAALSELPRGLSDPLVASRMPFGDHLEELRSRMWRALCGFAVIVALVFAVDGIGLLTNTSLGIAKPVMGLIARPVEQELQHLYDRRFARLVEQAKASAGEGREVAIDLDVHEL